jgi:DNA-binding NarL/FixJ family response regulator
MTQPLHVVETQSAAATLLRRLTKQGWTIGTGFVMPSEPWDLSRRKLVVSGPVEDTDDVGAVVLAAARGAGVVAVVDPRSTTGRALLDDLQRVGPVGDAPTEDETPSVAGLTVEECALLERLADGESIAGAAEAEFLSLRTANRRIAHTRKVFNVASTRAAVVEYVRRRDTAG